MSNAALDALKEALSLKRGEYRSVHWQIGASQKRIRDLDQQSAAVSREMSDLEKAIVALGGTVPVESDSTQAHNVAGMNDAVGSMEDAEMLRRQAEHDRQERILSGRQFMLDNPLFSTERSLRDRSLTHVQSA